MKSSWGRLPLPSPRRILEADWRFENLPKISDGDSLLAFGCGRSYGDSCINGGQSRVSTRRLNRFIAFDAQQGLLNCEAGVTLDDILRVIVPRGWFLPVVPGTRFVTLGGAVANDVHGKNHHHVGSFGCHVRSLKLLRSDGRRLHCSLEQNEEVFAATIGGLGLTGVITSVEVALIPIASDQLETQNLPFTSVEEFIGLTGESSDWEYTVAWIDTFARKGKVGRGIFSRARHSTRHTSLLPGARKGRLGLPFVPPVSLVHKYTVAPFNQIYHLAQARSKGIRCIHYQPFFFPLDAIANWNRIYGGKGFYQYQCVVPHVGAEESIGELLSMINASGESSFLAVLKEFGGIRSPGLLSFPRPGLTLALDFPNRGEKTTRLLDSFDHVVRSAGGALYPAKDGRMSAAMFESGFPQVEKFRAWMDPKCSSSFWRRVTQ